MNKNKDVAESERTRKLIRARAKHCYLNAFRVIQEIEGYADADYVEGIAVIEGVIEIEHGWVERDGVIVDPTLPNDNLVYFAGLRFRGQRELAEGLQIPKPSRTTDDFPIFYRFGWGGIESPEFRAALVAANRYIGDEVTAKRYEEWKPCYDMGA